MLSEFYIFTEWATENLGDCFAISELYKLYSVLFSHWLQCEILQEKMRPNKNK